MEKSKIVHGVRMESIGMPLQDKAFFADEYLDVGPGKQVMVRFFEDWYPKYATFPVLSDDVWVVTYPKAGTTWTQELVWCLYNDPDAPESKQPLTRRFPFLEFDSLLDPRLPDMLPPGSVASDDPMLPGNTWKIVQNLKSPRFIKSHLVKDLLPEQLWKVNPKIIYVIRDPRDVCVSYYFHNRKILGYKGTFDSFVDLFLDEKLIFCPLWKHYLDFWKIRDQPNILFLRFEDMKQDLGSAVRQVAKFLGKEVDDAKVSEIVHHCSFSQMSANPAANNETFLTAPTEDSKIRFMRKGEVGDWKNHLSEAHLKAFKEWTAKNLKGSDFPYYQDY